MSAQPNPTPLKCPQCSADLIPTGQDYIICRYCGSSLVLGRAGLQSSGAAPVAAKAVHGMQLQTFTCMDAQGTGMEVFHMLAPAGWKLEGGCRWLLDNPGMPAVVETRISNPQGGEAFELLPTMNFLWNGSGMLLPGTRYYGAEVGMPVPIQAAFTRFILPRYRRGVGSLQVVEITPQPDLPRLAKSEALVTPGASAEGGKARIRFNWQGTDYEEDIYGVVEVFRTMIPGMFGPTEIITWFIGYMFSFRALAGQLDATADLFGVMIQSFQLNPQWYAALKTVAQQMVQQQIQHIRSVGQIGTMLAQAGSQAREQNLADWYRRQEAFDQVSLAQSRSIRGVDGFVDPASQAVVELPSGYGHAWANAAGEYIITDDPTYNPNIDRSGTWNPLEMQ